MHILKTKTITWIEIKGPNKKDIEYLEKNFNLHPLVLKEILPPIDYPKIENFGDYLFITIFYPYFNRKTFQTIPFELDIIISKDYIITVHYKDIVPLKAIFDKCNLYEEIREEYTDEGTEELLYRIIEGIFSACFPKLSHIKQNIDGIEKLIYEGEYQKGVNQISLIKRDIIGFQRIIEPSSLVLKNLIKEAEKTFSKKVLPYFHNLKTLYEQINNILNTQFRTLSALDSTNQSLLSNKTNKIIKLLTIFSVIVFPLTLLASIFGMNTSHLPLAGSPNDFWIVVGIMFFATMTMILFFRIKKWI